MEALLCFCLPDVVGIQDSIFGECHEFIQEDDRYLWFCATISGMPPMCPGYQDTEHSIGSTVGPLCLGFQQLENYFIKMEKNDWLVNARLEINALTHLLAAGLRC